MRAYFLKRDSSDGVVDFQAFDFPDDLLQLHSPDSYQPFKCILKIS